MVRNWLIVGKRIDMAKLYFKIGSDWEEVVRLRNEIAKLKQELM